MDAVVRRLSSSQRGGSYGMVPLPSAPASDFALNMASESARAARSRATAAALTQIRYSGDDWLPTLLLWEARAMDRIMLPWGVVMGLTCLWTVPIMVCVRSLAHKGLVTAAAHTRTHAPHAHARTSRARTARRRRARATR